MTTQHRAVRWPFQAAAVIGMAIGAYILWADRDHSAPTPKEKFGAKRQLAALRPDSTSADTEIVGDVIVLYPSTHPRSALDAPVDSMAVVVNDGLRLKPDIRFVAAVAHVHRILTGEPLSPVTLVPRPSGWDIQYRGEVAGTLPDLPSFHDGERMLATWAAHVQPSAPPAPASSLDTTGLSADIDDFDAVHVARTLHVVDSLWQATHDPKLLPIAARGMVVLTVQTIDRTSVADAVPAQALAVTVLTHVPRERVLLASEMGYYGEAVTMADRDHPEHVAAFIAQGFGAGPTYSGSQSENAAMRDMVQHHVGRHLTERQRHRWVTLINEAADEVGLPSDPEFRSTFAAHIEWGSRIAVMNSATDQNPTGPTDHIPRWGWGSVRGPFESVGSICAFPTDEPIIP